MFKIILLYCVLMLYLNLWIKGLTTAQPVDLTETEERCSSLQFSQMWPTIQKQISELENKLKDQECTIKRLESQFPVQEQSKTITEIEEVIKHNESLEFKEADIFDHEQHINQLNKNLDSKHLEIKQLSNNLKSMNETIKNLEQEIILLKSQSRSDTKLIDELNDILDLNIQKLDLLIKSSEGDNRVALLRYKHKLGSCLPFENFNGIRTIHVPGIRPFPVYCDAQLAGSGWTVIQRRINGALDFNGNWSMYKKGFGNLSHEFFIGLEKLYLITKSKPHELFIQLDVNGTRKFARYDRFEVDSEAESYRLKLLGKCEGTAGDSLKRHVEMKFSTPDRDNDKHLYINCSKFHGPWWHESCYRSCLNGKYLKNGVAVNNQGIGWGSWRKKENGEDDFTVSMTFVQMMIRPKD